jgi:hypothetical protein
MMHFHTTSGALHILAYPFSLVKVFNTVSFSQRRCCSHLKTNSWVDFTPTHKLRELSVV